MQESHVRKSHCLECISILSENLLYLINKKVNVRAKPIGENFSDNLYNSVEEVNRPEFTDQRSTFFRNESNQGITEAPENHNFIV